MKKITITIDIKSGSKFQEDFARNAIKNMMDAFTLFFNVNHKKNSSSFTIKEE